MTTYLVEMRCPKAEADLWLSDCWRQSRSAADKRAGEIERRGWLARVTRKAPEPTVDYKTGLLRERGEDEMVYVTAGA
jgi:hypothetical protein